MSSVTSGGRNSCGIGKAEGKRRIVDHLRDRRHPGDRLQAALSLLRLAGLGAPAIGEGLQLLALGDLLLARRHLLGLPFRPLPLERVVAARVKRQLAAIEVEDVVDDIVEEVALVADDDDRRPVAGKEVLQPQHGFQIEVVGRLVEQQQVGRGEKEGRKRDPHPPPAREAVERAMLHILVEAEADEDAGGPRRRRIGFDRVQPLVDLGEPVRVLAAILLRHQCRTFDVGGKHRLERRRAAARRFLRDIAEPCAGRHVRGAVVGSSSPQSPAPAWTCRRRCGRRARHGCAAAATRSRRRGSSVRRDAP
jgi:hypothetical protein